MAKYPNIKLTQKGLDIAINADKSKKLIYTKIGIGDGRLSNNEDVLTLTAMKSRKIYADISDINNDTNNQVTLETIVSNKVVNEGFYAREIGIYAKLGENGEEVLYGYANAEDNCDYMPDKTQPIDELKLRITLIVGNVDNVTAVVNSSIIFITLADCRREIARHNADPLAHGDFARKKDYYTKAQTDAKLNGKANTAHGNHVPTTEQANNARFLRNDNSWQTVTPNNIGAYHKSETYHKNEVNTVIDQKVNTRVSKSGDTMTGSLGFANDVGTCLFGTMANNDVWRIYAGNAGSNVGYLALDTCDDGAEEICVRQFSGYFQNQVRVAQLLTQNGETTFPVSVTAPRFYATNGFEGIATKAHFPNGFRTANYSNREWGNQAGRTITSWDTQNGGCIDFRENGGTLNVKVDGTFYQGEGAYPVLDTRGGTITGAMTADTFYSNDWFRAIGNSGFYFQDHGGGWYMRDSDWIRAHGNKNIYTGGKIEADGGFNGNLNGKANSAGWADGAEYSNRAVRVENDYRNMRFHWSGPAKDGQPNAVWGGNDGENMYVYNPSNFTVNRANTAGTADNAKNFDGRSLQNILGLIDAANTGAVEARLEENGYIKIRNGFMLQWGMFGTFGTFSTAHETKWFDFPTPFPSKCLCVLLTVKGREFSNKIDFDYQVLEYNRTGAKILVQVFSEWYDIKSAAPMFFAIGC